jgi:hypothetical protein
LSELSTAIDVNDPKDASESTVYVIQEPVTLVAYLRSPFVSS